MRNDYYTNSKDYINRWVISYADFVTMLLALFMVMYAVINADNQKLYQMQKKMEKVISSTKVTNVTKYQVSSPSDNSLYVEKILKENLPNSKSLKLLRGDKGLIIRVNNTMLFNEGSADIRPEAQRVLADVIKVLTKIDNPVIIEGHTDSTPIQNAKYPSNWELSTARATNIIAYIIQKSNIPAKRLCAVGYGEYSPIADNTLSSGRLLNRRVDIIVLDKK